MKVCYVTDYHVKISGGPQSLLNLMDEIQKYGVSPYLVCHAACDGLTEAEKRGIPTAVIPGKKSVIAREDVSFVTYLKYPVKQVYNRFYLKDAVKYLKDNQIELVHLNSVLACTMWAAAAQKCGIPYVWHIREFVDQDHNSVIIGKRYTYGLLRKADRVIAISDEVKRVWEERLGRECVRIYNGLNYEENYDSIDGKFSRKTLNCIIVGRVLEKKGQMDAVRAVEELIRRGHLNVRLTIVGYRGVRAYEKDLKQYVQEHGLEDYVRILDFTSDLKEIRRDQDVGLTCSYAEAFGRVTIEYMLGGLLAIGSRSGGTPELIREGETGFLYEPGDHMGLAAVLERVMQNREKAKEIAEKGHAEAAEKFLIENTAQNVYSLYQDVLKDRGRSAPEKMC